MLFVDRVYSIYEAGHLVFWQVLQTGSQDLRIPVEHLAERIGSPVEKQGLIERDTENAGITEDGQGDPLDDPLGHSITYRWYRSSVR